MPERPPSAKLLLVVALPLVLVLGIVLGGHPRLLPDVVADGLVGDEETRVVAEAFDEIQDGYYRRTDRGDLADAAIKGAVSDLDDRFSNYFTPKEFRAFNDETNSQFSGVGVAIRGVPQGLRVQTVYDDSPAKRAGLRVGDIVTAVGGRSLAGKPEQTATTLIKGPSGTDVRLTFVRGDRKLRRTLTRATISVPPTSLEMERAHGRPVAHISLSSFSSGAHGYLVAEIRRAKRQGSAGIVFDLRGNGGGLVREAQLVASQFLSRGPIVTTKGRSVPKRTLDAVGQPIAPRTPLVVLMDGGTASASEIVAGALQDRERAKLVGVPTFGKGVFQEVIELSNGGALDITAGQYFTPDGRNLGGAGVKSGTGLAPDVSAADDPDTPRRDEALDRALDVIARQL